MSQSRIGDRRAAPPRPTLLIGDLTSCQAAFERLQQRVLELSLAQQAALEAGDTDDAAAAASAWRDLVPRCRALRETLTSLRQLSHFTRQVYECAADVCARAGDLGEALKALQMLVHHIYPALAAAAAGAAGASAAVGEPGGAPGLQRQPQQCRAEPAAGGRPWRQGGGGRHGEDEEDEDAWLAGPSTQLDEAAVAAALQQTAFRRWPEAAGALVLYFTAARPVGAPSGDAQLDTLATLRRLPPQLLRSDPVRAALRLRAALAAGDYVTLFRLRQGAPPPLVRSLLSGSVTAAARERALAVMAAAYRNISVAAVCRMLALGTPRLLHACLKLMADRGHAASGRALSGLQQEEAAALAAADLVFKG